MMVAHNILSYLKSKLFILIIVLTCSEIIYADNSPVNLDLSQAWFNSIMYAKNRANTINTSKLMLASSSYRLMLDADLSDRLSVEFHGKLQFDLTNSELNSIKVNANNLSASIERLNLYYQAAKFDLTLGKQAISFGKTFFWSPLDIFKPRDPTSLSTDYRNGIEAIKLDIPSGNFSGISLVGKWNSDTAMIAHYHTNQSGWDISFQGGKLHKGLQLGLGLSGDISGVELRAEATHYNPKHAPAQNQLAKYTSAVLGSGYLFQNSVYLQLEYFHNAAASKNILIAYQLQQKHLIQNVSRNLIAASLSYPFNPLLNGQITSIRSLSDHSWMLLPSISYSLNNEADLILSATINKGRKTTLHTLNAQKTEFGDLPNQVFLQVKWWF